MPPPHAIASMPACARNRSNSLRRKVFKAQAAQTLTHQQLDRITVLAVRSDASLQERDETRDEAARADADVRVAQVRFAEAQLGPTAEERALSDAQLHAAEAARDVVEAHAAKMLLRAPAAGEIGLIVSEVGEAVVPGETVLTLLPEGGVWFGFNAREDALGGMGIGAQVPVAAQGAAASGRVVEMRNWDEFAAWRAAREPHGLTRVFFDGRDLVVGDQRRICATAV